MLPAGWQRARLRALLAARDSSRPVLGRLSTARPPAVDPPTPYRAMARVDPATGRPRGFMRMGRHPRLDSVLFTLDVRDAYWLEANRWAQQVPADGSTC